MRIMKQKLIVIIMMLLPSIAFANLDLITWKGTYYHAVPINKETSSAYCKAHSPGSFIHTVRDKFFVTDKGIKLDHPIFNIDKVESVYLIHGSLIATGKTANKWWHDHLYYFAYKYTEAGDTKGVWYSSKCKGLYKGTAISKINEKML